jgi:iron(III) transport system substrate-binding protein
MATVTRRIFLGMSAAATTVALGKLTKIQPVSAQNKAINLYSARHYNTDSKLYQNFTNQTGIKVNLIEGEADALLERIKSEGRKSKADVFLTTDAGRLWRAKQAGIFTPISSKELTDKIPSAFRDPDRNWFGFSKRLRVIMYNKKMVQLPTSFTYENLADSQWKKQIVIRSSSNIYNQSFVAWLIAIHGEKEVEKWCRGVVANFARPPQGNDRAQIEAVAAGVAKLTLANTYYLASYNEPKNPKKQAIFNQIGLFFPNQNSGGSHVNISGGGVVKTSQNKESAIKFLEYLVSPSAQNFFAQGNNEYPVVNGVELAPVLKGFGTFKSNDTNVSKYGPNLPIAVKIMDRAGWK